MTAPAKTVKQVLEAATMHLETKGIENPRLVCECLAGRLLRCGRLDLYLQYERVLSPTQLKAMRRGVKRATAGEPVQYICGEWDFMGHTFKVDRRVLIPRPETEVLAETVLNCSWLWQRKPVVLDIGTGSGCIAISLALARPDAVYLAFDISEDALEVARANAEALNVTDRVVFATGDLSDLVEPERLDAIVGNLPYIRTSDYEKLPANVREHEPRQALDGGEDGLTFIRSIVQDAAFMLKGDGRIFLEIGEQQGAQVTELCRQAGFVDVTVSPDLAGRHRIVSGRLDL